MRWPGILLTGLLALTSGVAGARDTSSPAGQLNPLFSYAIPTGASALTLNGSAANGWVIHSLVVGATGETGLTITLPASPVPDSQIHCVINGYGATLTVTFGANTGQTLVSAAPLTSMPSMSLSTSRMACYLHQAATKTWQRIQ